MSFEAGGALVILALLAALVAFRRWAPPRSLDQRQTDRQHLLMAGQILGALATVVVAELVLTSWFQWDSATGAAVAGGIAIILATTTRFKPFWDHPKAQWLRNALGDGLTRVLYLLVGLGCLIWGYDHETAYGTFAADCHRRLQTSQTTQDRMAVMRRQSRSLTRHSYAGDQPITCGWIVEHSRGT